MGDGSLRDVRDRALEAARILNSPLFREVLDAMDAQCVAAWRAAREVAEREHWWRMQSCAAVLKRELFRELQGAALRDGGKDREISSALEEAKRTGKRSAR